VQNVNTTLLTSTTRLSSWSARSTCGRGSGQAVAILPLTQPESTANTKPLVKFGFGPLSSTPSRRSRKVG